MKRFLILLVFIPFFGSAQIYDHGRIFSDILEYTHFNQGYIDAQEYFNGTRDVVMGVCSLHPVALGVSTISYLSKPRDQRLLRGRNPNREYLYSNVDYYNGYKYGAKKKKRKRMRQGFFGILGASVAVVVTVIVTFFN